MWNHGEPNNLDNMEGCVMIYSSGLLNDAWCNSPLLYICEKPPSKYETFEISCVVSKSSHSFAIRIKNEKWLSKNLGIPGDIVPDSK